MWLSRLLLLKSSLTVMVLTYSTWRRRPVSVLDEDRKPWGEVLGVENWPAHNLFPSKQGGGGNSPSIDLLPALLSLDALHDLHIVVVVATESKLEHPDGINVWALHNYIDQHGNHRGCTVGNGRCRRPLVAFRQLMSRVMSHIHLIWWISQTPDKRWIAIALT